MRSVIVSNAACSGRAGEPPSDASSPASPCPWHLLREAQVGFPRRGKPSGRARTRAVRSTGPHGRRQPMMANRASSLPLEGRSSAPDWPCPTLQRDGQSSRSAPHGDAASRDDHAPSPDARYMIPPGPMSAWISNSNETPGPIAGPIQYCGLRRGSEAKSEFFRDFERDGHGSIIGY